MIYDISGLYRIAEMMLFLWCFKTCWENRDGSLMIDTKIPESLIVILHSYIDTNIAAVSSGDYKLPWVEYESNKRPN